ncbi:MAG: ferritin [Candidatus Bathyarchaeota archaeon B24]|nr:MAG: ferritin [Candidatus Bathyarchaeota archaeon B24]RLI26551.1 MAG: ferritin [Candidatus Bathyarchaeota archaeon]
MVSKELLDLMNKAISMELQVSIQYMWQHVMWRGLKGFVVKDELKKIAVSEMKHAESIAERLVYLGGVPTTKPAPIMVGGSLREMIKQDAKNEEDTIKLYKQIESKAREEGDITTARLFRKILADEEEHHDFFTSLLEEL